MPNVEIREATDQDTRSIRELLCEVKLPVESIDSGVTTYFVGIQDNSLVSVAGFEFYGDDALLRSVAVLPALQKKGLGDQQADWMVHEAKRRSIKRIVLLTETAEQFFAKKGFKRVDRRSIDNEAMKKSSEFAFACPASAVCMVLFLEGQ